jgi:NAD-dependent dihydropyrimidine dehydrogenase PreA subunit
MPYVIVDRCTKDGSCVEVCPVACIHTTPDAPQFYIDPDVCIECEQCKVVCPVDAIFVDTELPPEHLIFADVNASFFRQHKAAAEPVTAQAAFEIVEAAHAYAAAAGLAITAVVVDDAGAA